MSACADILRTQSLQIFKKQHIKSPINIKNVLSPSPVYRLSIHQESKAILAMVTTRSMVMKYPSSANLVTATTVVRASTNRMSVDIVGKDINTVSVNTVQIVERIVAATIEATSKIVAASNYVRTFMHQLLDFVVRKQLL